MDLAKQLATLEKRMARTDARETVTRAVMAYLLSREISESTLETLKERLIANALQTKAPDAYIEAMQQSFDYYVKAWRERPNHG